MRLQFGCNNEKRSLLNKNHVIIVILIERSLFESIPSLIVYFSKGGDLIIQVVTSDDIMIIL